MPIISTKYMKCNNALKHKSLTFTQDGRENLDYSLGNFAGKFSQTCKEVITSNVHKLFQKTEDGVHFPTCTSKTLPLKLGKHVKRGQYPS